MYDLGQISYIMFWLIVSKSYDHFFTRNICHLQETVGWFLESDRWGYIAGYYPNFPKAYFFTSHNGIIRRRYSQSVRILCFVSWQILWLFTFSFDYFSAVINVPTYDTVCSMFKSKWACPLLANGKVPWQTYNFSCNQFEFKLSSMVPFFSLSINWWIFGQQHLIWLTLPYSVFCFHARLCNLYLHGHCGKKLVVWMIFYWWWDTSWCRFMHFCT